MSDDAQAARVPRPRNRPSALTRAVIDKVSEALTAGAYFKDACEFAGISRATGHRWIAEADEGPPDPHEFTNPWVGIDGDPDDGDSAWRFESLPRADGDPGPGASETLTDVRNAWERATRHYALACDFRDARAEGQAKAKVVALARIRLAGQNGTWQADAWWLERAFPDEYGRNRVEVTGKDGGDVEVNVRRDSIEALLANQAATHAAQAQALDPFRTMADD